MIVVLNKSITLKKLIKRTLFRTLGQENYLQFLNRGFYFAYSLGLLKKDNAYQYNYFVKHLINKGDYVLDLGANLGYFAKIFSKIVGSEGEVICIEPVRPFFRVLKKCIGNRRNVVLYNYALGTENKMIKMVVPKMDGYLRTGLAHVPTKEELENKNQYEFNVEMVKGSELLQNLPHLNYIKCDIEGYEEFVLPDLQCIIEKHKPIIQLETWGEHRASVLHLLTELGYIPFGLINNKLTKKIDTMHYAGDFLLVHESGEDQLISKLQLNNLIAV